MLLPVLYLQCKNLKLYKDYVEMYRRSLDCLERSKFDPNFKKFLEVSYQSHTHTHVQSHVVHVYLLAGGSGGVAWVSII